MYLIHPPPQKKKTFLEANIFPIKLAKLESGFFFFLFFCNHLYIQDLSSKYLM